jgi:SnoaL-like domain
VFADDARVEFIESGTNSVYVGRSEVLRLLTETKRKWAAAAQSRGAVPYVRHFVASHLIELTGRDSARGRSYVAVVKAHGLDHWGRYLDEYRCEGERWLISARRAITDGFSEVPVP